MKIPPTQKAPLSASIRLLVHPWALLFLGGSIAQAQDWVGDASQNWNDPANWSSNAYPAGVNAIVNTDAAGVFPIISGNTVQVADTIIGNQPGGKARLDHRAGIHRTRSTNQTFVGAGGSTGLYNLANTSVVDNTNITGFATGSGTLHAGLNLNVGDGGGTGTVNINTTGSINFTAGSGSGFSIAGTGGTGTVNLRAGTVNDLQTLVGGAGNGRLNMSAGTWNTNSWTLIGAQPGSDGNVQMTGGTWNQNHTDYLVIGQLGTGTFTMSGGVLNNPAVVDTSVRTTNKGNVIVGRFDGGDGFWDLKGTATARIRSLAVGGGTGAIGRMDISENAQLIAPDNDAFIGQAGSGTVNMNGGSASFNQGWTFIGADTSGQGTLNVSGGTFSSWQYRIGVLGTGKVNVTGSGLLTATDRIMVGLSAGGVGELKVSGGSVTAIDMILGDLAGAAGSVIQAGGTVSLAGDLDLLHFGNSGSYSLSGGLLSVDGGIDATNGAFNFSGGMLTRSNAGPITFLGNLDTGAEAATLGLQSGKTLSVSGTLNILDGIALDLAGLTIPAPTGAPATGSYLLGADTSIVGTFDALTTTVLNLNNLANATMISETVGEAGLYPPDQPVFWIQEDNVSHQISLRYSIPEPSVGLLLLAGGIGAVVRRHRA